MTLPGPALFCPLLCAGGRIQALRTDIQTAILEIFSLQNGYEPESNGKALRMQLLERGMLAFKQASEGVAHAHPMPNTTGLHVLIVLRTCGHFHRPQRFIWLVCLISWLGKVSNHRAPLDHDGFAAGRTFSGHRFFIACSFCLALPSTSVWQLPRQQA